jgi:hypothetical protein
MFVPIQAKAVHRKRLRSRREVSVFLSRSEDTIGDHLREHIGNSQAHDILVALGRWAERERADRDRERAERAERAEREQRDYENRHLRGPF